MKKILGILIIFILFLIIIISCADDGYYEENNNYRVEKNKVVFTLFFCGLKREFSLNL